MGNSVSIENVQSNEKYWCETGLDCFEKLKYLWLGVITIWVYYMSNLIETENTNKKKNKHALIVVMKEMKEASSTYSIKIWNWWMQSKSLEFHQSSSLSLSSSVQALLILEIAGSNMLLSCLKISTNTNVS